MCLAVPGKVVSISENPLGMAMGMVSFGGIMKEVCLAYVPEVKVGDYVLIHVGFALSRLDEKEAAEVFRMLQELGDLEELEPPPGPEGTPTARQD
jgi:hydrogenase expression/formation protein HypC